MRVLILLFVLLLSGCATPVTILKAHNGQVVRCGGDTTASIAGGVIGYYFQKKNDEKCVEDYKKNGFK